MVQEANKGRLFSCIFANYLCMFGASSIFCFGGGGGVCVCD